jgi:hypothetical protein
MVRNLGCRLGPRSRHASSLAQAITEERGDPAQYPGDGREQQCCHPRHCQPAASLTGLLARLWLGRWSEIVGRSVQEPVQLIVAEPEMIAVDTQEHG